MYLTCLRTPRHRHGLGKVISATIWPDCSQSSSRGLRQPEMYDIWPMFRTVQYISAACSNTLYNTSHSAFLNAGATFNFQGLASGSLHQQQHPSIHLPWRVHTQPQFWTVVLFASFLARLCALKAGAYF